MGRAQVVPAGEAAGASQPGPLVRLSAYLGSVFAAERGATMVEYAIIVGLLVVVSVAVIGFLGRDVFEQYQQAEELFP